MNPLTLFLLIFLAACFFMILVRRNLTGRQKFFLMLNPAVLVMILSVQISRAKEDRECAEALAPVAKSLSTLLLRGGADAQKGAALLRKFTAEKQEPDWKKLARELARLADPRDPSAAATVPDGPAEKYSGEGEKDAEKLDYSPGGIIVPETPPSTPPAEGKRQQSQGDLIP